MNLKNFFNLFCLFYYYLICNYFFAFIKAKRVSSQYIENVFNTSYKKNALFIYITEPFLTRRNYNMHQNRVQAYIFATFCKQFGYNVDVVDESVNTLDLDKHYDLIIDSHPKKKSFYEKNVKDDSKKIVYLTGSNPEFSNQQERQRILDVNRRRNSNLKPKRNCLEFKGDVIESFNSIFLIGNTTTKSTYSNFSIPIMTVNNSGNSFFSYPKFSEKQSNSFLFLSSSSQVHKGLDLLLDVFSKHNQFNLYVCSDFKSENDFFDLYKDELTAFSNIKGIGMLDLKGRHFQSILNICSYLVLPSCSEGMSGAVLTAMSAGLIPIISDRCGVDYISHEYPLESFLNPDTFLSILTEFSSKSVVWIQEEGLRFREIYNQHYTIQNYQKMILDNIKATILL